MDKHTSPAMTDEVEFESRPGALKVLKNRAGELFFKSLYIYLAKNNKF